MSKENKYPCPSCGFLVFDTPPKNYDACPLCKMQDGNILGKLEKRENGDSRGYLKSVVTLVLSLSLLLLLYYKLNPFLMDIWDARSGWYLDEYRTWGAKVWRMLYRATYSWMFLLLPVLWMFSAFLMQTVLKKDKARIFNNCHIALIIIISAMAVLAYCGLLIMPLMMRSHSQP